MSWKVVFAKEFTEVMRDKRMRFQIFISPLIITPLILAGIGTMAKREAKESQARTAVVATVRLETAPKLATALEPTEKDAMRFVQTDEASVESGIRARKFDAAIVLPEDAAERELNDQTIPVQVRFDMSNEDSRVSGNKVSDFLKQRSENIGAQRLMEAGFSQQLAKPIDVGDVPVKGNGGRGVLMMSMMLPYMLVLYAVIGGLFVANDSVAGEKERGTLESLLVTPISREELARGKFAAVAAAALVSGLLSLVGMLWPFYVKLSAFSWMTEGGAAFTGFQIASMALVLVPLSAMGAGILLTISTIARNQKEAQTWLGPVMMVVSVLSMMSMMMRPNTSVFVAAVPMLGPALVLKQALQSIINPVFIGIAAGTSVVYAVLAVWLAARMFMKESVLLRT